MPLKRPFVTPLHDLVIPADQPNHAPATLLWAKPPSAPKAGGRTIPAAPAFAEPAGALEPPPPPPAPQLTYEPLQSLQPLQQPPLAPPASPRGHHDQQQQPSMPRQRSASHLQQIRILRAAVSTSTPTLSPLSLRSSVAHSPKMIGKAPRVPPVQAGGARAYAAYLAQARSLLPHVPSDSQPIAPLQLGAPPVRVLHISGVGGKGPRGRSAPLASALVATSLAGRPPRPTHAYRAPASYLRPRKSAAAVNLAPRPHSHMAMRVR